MTLRDRVREWLGISELRVTVEALATKNLLSAAEKAQRDRHEELLGAISGIRLLFQEQHLQKRSAPVVPYDWEGVQLQELAEMLANPPKDEN